MSQVQSNIFSLLEGVECDPAKVIENAVLVHKASPAPAAATKKEKIAKNEAARDLQQHLLNSSQNQFRNRRRGYSSNGRQQENSKGSQEKDGEVNNKRNNNGGRYYENGNGYQGGSRGGYHYNNRYRNNNGGGYNKNHPQPGIAEQGSASNIQGDDWQEVVSRRQSQNDFHQEAGYYRRRGYNSGRRNRGCRSSYNGSESTEMNDGAIDVDGGEKSPAIDAASADTGSEKAPAIDAASADIVDAKSEIGSATGDSKSGDGAADATGEQESSEKKFEGEEKKKKKKKKSKSKSKNGEQFDRKEKEAQPREDDTKLMTLKEYEKLQLQKKEALASLKSSEGKVESESLKKKEDKEQAEKKKASNDVFPKPQKLAAGLPRGGGNYQYNDRRNYGDGGRFDNNRNRVAGERAFNGGGRGRGRGSDGGFDHNNTTSVGGAVSTPVVAGGGAKGGKEFAIDPKQFPVLVRKT